MGAAPDPVRAQQRLILALGGHEFSRRRGNEAIVEYMLALAPRERPRICLLPTASGDASEQIAAFRSALGARACELSELSLFRLEDSPIPVAEHILAQDMVYVGGGSMVNLLAIWRAHGIDRILVEAWRRGVVLCGQSAGAMCWFEAGISRSVGSATTVEGLGVVPGALSVHHHRDPDRRLALLDLVRRRGGRAYGVDDGAGLVIRGGRVASAISGVDGAGAWLVVRTADGEVEERPIESAPLPAPREAIDEVGADVAELRRVMASRAGRSGATAAAWSRRRPGS
ncbi:MAG: Type 1 glutamine amidotransferase-like domain-containing protein [Solirubrobacterales bacterium]